MPDGMRLREEEAGRISPFHDLNGFVYHQNWLHNLLIASSIGGLRLWPQNPLALAIIIAASLPAIGRSLSASFIDMRWVSDACLLSCASQPLATGAYANLRGHKRAII